MREYFKKVEEKTKSMPDDEFIKLLNKIGFDDFIEQEHDYVKTANIHFSPENFVIRAHKKIFIQKKNMDDLYQIEIGDILAKDAA